MTTLIKCPTCKIPAEYSGNPFRPFCSERCKLIDLGAWASGDYSIPCIDQSVEHELEEL